MDEHTVFEYEGKFYSNKESVVHVSGGFEFRNPPVFLPTVYREPRRGSCLKPHTYTEKT